MKECKVYLKLYAHSFLRININSVVNKQTKGKDMAPKIVRNAEGEAMLVVNPVQDFLDVFPNFAEECPEDYEALLELMEN